ncbi:type I 3-dehydroquinate dehydratase [Enterococcus bulliens]|uniref:type I 3-dehydroquinate dehydratase n=1 Tax=uncultured Enterococcus sp. TaxID=167972 RepID=UPI0025E05ADF|nr:type I 3-dehydroquinate dehydratase [uncultured Enterococcus sp.]
MLQIKKVEFGVGRPKLVVPLTAKTQTALVEQAQKAHASAAQIVEWRADLFEEYETSEELVAQLAILRKELPEQLLLFTFRTKAEGGARALSLAEYETLCLLVAQSHDVDLIDLELRHVEFLGRGFVQKIKKENVCIIMSAHYFEETPKDGQLLFQIGLMNQFQADIGKIAAMPKMLSDVLRMMMIIERAKGLNQLPLAIMSMGDLGKISRVSSEAIGSVLTFGALEEVSAPGQIPVADMERILELLAIKG